MNLAPLLLVLLLGAVGYAVFLWRKISSLEGTLRTEREAVESKRTEIEKARKESRDKREEVEDLRKQLQEAKAKLKQREPHDGKKKAKRASQQEAEPEGSDSAVAAVVHVSDMELGEAHRREMERMAQEVADAKAEVAKANEALEKMKRAEERKKADAERAAKALAGTEDLEKIDEDAGALRTQLETLMRAAADERKRLEIELKKSDHKARTALKRATNNHSLYLVIKGQLELAEDKLALLRRKYEGAKSPDQMRTAHETYEDETAPPYEDAAADDPAVDAPRDVDRAIAEAEEMPSAEAEAPAPTDESKAPV
jgi:chromosome segregation ATPase